MYCQLAEGIVEHAFGLDRLIQEASGIKPPSQHKPDLRCIADILAKRTKKISCLELQGVSVSKSKWLQMRKDTMDNDEKYFYFLVIAAMDLIPKIRAGGYSCITCVKELFNVAIETLESKEEFWLLHLTFLCSGERLLRCG